MANILEILKKCINHFRNPQSKLPTEIYGPSPNKKTLSDHIFFKTKRTPTQEIEQALSKFKELEYENIKLNATGSNYDNNHFQPIRDYGKSLRKQSQGRYDPNGQFYILLNLLFKPKAQDLLIQLYESDPTILESQRISELVQTIRNTIITDDSPKEQSFANWVIEQLFVPAKFEEQHGITKKICPEYDFRELIEHVMSLDTFINNVIECSVVEMQASLQNASVIGKKFGLSHALARSINPNCKIPESLADKYNTVEEYQKFISNNIQELTDDIIKDCTISKRLAVFRKKYVDSQIFSRNALALNTTDFDTLVQHILADDISNGNINPNVTNFDRDLMKNYLYGLRHGFECISRNNYENTYFQDFRDGKTFFCHGEVLTKLPQEDITH